jgi:hypothetical protein
MIRIQEHLNIVDADLFLDTLAEGLWDSLNQKLLRGIGFKQNSLINKCKKIKKKTKLKSYLKKYASNNPIVCKRQKDFFDFLLASNAGQLKRIVVSRPNQFLQIKADIYKILEEGDIYTIVGGGYQQTQFGKLLSEKIFNYKAFRGSNFCKELFSKIGFKSTTCPYCNDNKLNIIKLRTKTSNAIKQKAYLDLDHFYPQSQHPFFAVSFYNLVPTCHDCNSNDKKDKSFAIETHIHPYHEAFDNFYRFRISLRVLLGDPFDKIDIEKLPGKPLDKTLDDLNLEARYNTNLLQGQNLVKYFLDYKHYIGTETENAFMDAIFKLNGGIPKDRKDILKFQRGKMNRDILKLIDIGNVLELL